MTTVHEHRREIEQYLPRKVHCGIKACGYEYWLDHYTQIYRHGSGGVYRFAWAVCPKCDQIMIVMGGWNDKWSNISRDAYMSLPTTQDQRKEKYKQDFSAIDTITAIFMILITFMFVGLIVIAIVNIIDLMF